MKKERILPNRLCKLFRNRFNGFENGFMFKIRRIKRRIVLQERIIKKDSILKKSISVIKKVMDINNGPV